MFWFPFTWPNRRKIQNTAEEIQDTEEEIQNTEEEIQNTEDEIQNTEEDMCQYACYLLHNIPTKAELLLEPLISN